MRIRTFSLIIQVGQTFNKQQTAIKDTEQNPRLFFGSVKLKIPISKKKTPRYPDLGKKNSREFRIFGYLPDRDSKIPTGKSRIPKSQISSTTNPQDQARDSKFSRKSRNSRFLGFDFFIPEFIPEKRGNPESQRF